MASIKVAVNGALGKMGTEVVSALCKEPDMLPVAAVDPRADRDSLTLPDGSGSILLSNDLGQAIKATSPDAVVDFTISDAVPGSARTATGAGVNMVIGTTGISDDILKQLDQMVAENGVGIFVAPNFALGAVVLMHLARQAAPYFEYAEIIEAHHEAKIDSPSGTALAIALSIAGDKQFEHNDPEKETLDGTRGGNHNGVSVHSMRMAGRSAHHEVVFGTAGQTVSLRHDVLGRDCYMPGVMRAVREVVNLKGLVVGLDKILGL